MTPSDTLTKAVRAALESEPAVDLHHNAIDVEARDGLVTLHGEVGDIVAKRLAPHLVAAVPGVHGVLDRLRVTPSETRGDGAILDHLYSALTQEPCFRSYAIEVRAQNRPELGTGPRDGDVGSIVIGVADGVVTLEGHVESLTHKRLADVLAWWVTGTVDVDNRLRVVPPEQDSDDEITDAVRIVLEKDPWLDASQIRVRTQERQVTLEGLLHSREQKEMAEWDVWYVLGVHGVVNNIEVRP